MKKIAVDVECSCQEQGSLLPLSLKWADGRKWIIDRVLHTCISYSGEYDGIRYTVMIGNEERYLYHTGSGWYVIA
ncbi:MAG: hypothetical protein IKO68_05540 [Oscillospiraceae bacterium]|nr:hypothetical protein [Oscillospiraceae bacterium]